MKNILFIRHNKLAPPYDNYSELTLQELSDLAMQRIEPSIMKISANDVQRNELFHDIEKIECIISSTQKRALQTAEALRKYNRHSIPIISTPLLCEIVFDPYKLVSNNQFKKQGMVAVREAFFKVVLSNELNESMTDIFFRIQKLTQYLHERKEKNIICVTHGFYMRFLELFYVHDMNTSDSVTLEDLYTAHNYENLKGFGISLVDIRFM